MAEGREKPSPAATSRRRLSPARRKVGQRLSPWWPRCPAQLMALSLHLPLHPFLPSLGGVRACGRRSSPLPSLRWLLDTADTGPGSAGALPAAPPPRGRGGGLARALLPQQTPASGAGGFSQPGEPHGPLLPPAPSPLCPWVPLGQAGTGDARWPRGARRYSPSRAPRVAPRPGLADGAGGRLAHLLAVHHNPPRPPDRPLARGAFLRLGATV